MTFSSTLWKVEVACWGLVLGLSLVAGCSQNAPVQTTQSPTPEPSSPLTSAPMSSHGAMSDKLTYTAPPEWISQQPSSNMRQAQYSLPRAEGDPEDASLVVYYFGKGQGGSVEANLERWTNQMSQPDGSPSNRKANTRKLQVNGINVSLLDVTGTYRPDMMSGSPHQVDQPNYRMRAAVLETSAGPYFYKLVGPEKTVARWDEAFMKFIESSQFK